LRLVAARQGVKRAAEEIADEIIEFLNAIEFKRKHVARSNVIAGRSEEPVILNAAAQRALDDHLGINNFAEWDTASMAGSAEFFILMSNAAFIWIANPGSQMRIKFANPRVEFRLGEPAVGANVFIGERIVEGFLSKGLRMSLEQLSEEREERESPPCQEGDA
jgi:hypothetical protein